MPECHIFRLDAIRVQRIMQTAVAANASTARAFSSSEHQRLQIGQGPGWWAFEGFLSLGWHKWSAVWAIACSFTQRNCFWYWLEMIAPPVITAPKPHPLLPVMLTTPPHPPQLPPQSPYLTPTPRFHPHFHPFPLPEVPSTPRVIVVLSASFQLPVVQTFWMIIAMFLSVQFHVLQRHFMEKYISFLACLLSLRTFCCCCILRRLDLVFLVPPFLSSSCRPRFSLFAPPQSPAERQQ